jgi:hypothetical protein
VGPRAGLDTEVRGKSLVSAGDRTSLPLLDTILTELHQLLLIIYLYIINNLALLSSDQTWTCINFPASRLNDPLETVGLLSALHLHCKYRRVQSQYGISHPDIRVKHRAYGHSVATLLNLLSITSYPTSTVTQLWQWLFLLPYTIPIIIK